MELYVVKNEDGKWFRPSGYSNMGREKWVDDIGLAKIYTRIGTARAQITFWTNYGIKVKLVRLKVEEIEEIDESKRVAKSIKDKERRKAEQERRYKEWEVEQAKKDLEEAQNKLTKLKGKV